MNTDFMFASEVLIHSIGGKLVILRLEMEGCSVGV